MKLITTTAAGAGLAAALIGLTIVGSAPEEVSGNPVAAPTDTVLPEPEPYVDGDSIIHIPGPAAGPADPACAELDAQRAAAREAGVPVITVPTELMKCIPGAMG